MQLESTFIEIINHKESNDIIGVIYICMDTTQFTDSELTTKLSLEEIRRFISLVLSILIF